MGPRPVPAPRPDAAAATAATPAVLADWGVAHDFTFSFGGAERVTRQLLGLLPPDAPLHYLAGSQAVVDQTIRPVDGGPPRAARPAHQVLPRWVNRTSFHAATPSYPRLIAAERPIEGNLLASSYAFAHHLRCTGRKVVYCHSPMRQIWSGFQDYRSSGSVAFHLALGAWARSLRRHDIEAARTADAYIATNDDVAQRIEECYGITAHVVAPAIDPVFHVTPDSCRGDYLLWVGRITEPYKNLTLVLDAMRQLTDLRLVVAGDGPDRARLQAAAPSNVAFVGEQRSMGLAPLYREAVALIFSSEDDFGLVPLEALACGTPVVALRKGGARHTVSADAGVFFDEATVPALVAAVRACADGTWSQQALARSVAHYSYGRFAAEIRQILTA